MPYEILEHEADAGVRGIGSSLEEAFCEAARGMFSLMVDLEEVRPERAVPVAVEAETLEVLFVSWLGELLALRDLRGMVFSRFEAKIKKADGGWALEGKAYGEPLDPARHKPAVEVKAATYYGVKVGKDDGRYIAQCVVDL
ncbi:archease [Candidatus Acetothermia bacterium]|nr:MAG: archease [Candidatus Acetothermia bacterium]RLE32925.1 MAG: archease [Candidatus Acetothermia bacterium]